MQQYIIYKNTCISFFLYGKGPVVVLLHGLLSSSKMWAEFISKLTTRNSVICIDLLGHGNSDCLGYVHTMEDMAAIVKAVLTHLNIRRVILIGHSMGGYVALAFAEKYPKYVKKIGLINSTAEPDSAERQDNRLRTIAIAQTHFKNVVYASINHLFTEKAHSQYSNEIETCKKIALKTSVQGFIACTEGIRIRKDRTFVLASKAYETLLVAGKTDSIINHDTLIELAKTTKTPLIALSGGHMSYIENKEQLSALILEFTKRS